ncbi:damage-inducible protein DinB [Lysinibacillus contaminans]|uniref:Damage-inducible protein DinB n=1 Tax=Lysinibacillus contaminans TaxID=1293441 RepID=A0ABR5K223_9BACI|nr:DinB family protein [Lysinibacillus contaminans]KOS68987.1 damage-inducible protein DinB [Lysinibacillus contaminans]
MYRKVEDFLTDWQVSAKGTTKAIQAISNDSMDVAIVEGHNTLGWLASHLVEVAIDFGQSAGLTMPAYIQQYTNIEETVEAYQKVAVAYSEQVATYTDEQLLEDVPAFGGQMPRGKLLRILINHQTHHLGQMTVLLRQSGLKVPPVMGPTKEMQTK